MNIFAVETKKSYSLNLNQFLNANQASLEKIPIKESRFDKVDSKINNESTTVLKVEELMQKFKHLPHISKRLLKNLKKMKFEAPLAIQSLCFPLMLKGQNLICVAKTGSGKTLAFVLPALIRLHYHYKNNFHSFNWQNCEEPEDFFKKEVYTLSANPKIGVSTLILVPSKELAIQIFEVTKKLARKTKIKCGILLSEDSKKDQFKVNINHFNPKETSKRPGPDRLNSRQINRFGFKIIFIFGYCNLSDN
jgi:superfamily II DNA/RNA helicase